MSGIRRVLSIQSHVVSGYVGNKSATFPLQILGFEVDAINSVQFSNHTGYKVKKGQVLNEKDLEVLVDGLMENSLDTYSHLLTGYVGSPSFLSAIANTVTILRNKNPNLVYVCDPVMGDNGEMYVPQTLLEIYKTSIIPLADIITPNQFELELLTGQPVRTLADAWSAINELHEIGCKTVVISSTNLGSEGNLLALASSIARPKLMNSFKQRMNPTGECVEDGKKEKVVINIPLLDATFTGTGDLFTALFLAWMTKTQNNLQLSLEKTISTEHSILKRTLARAKELAGPNNTLTCAHLELKLIDSKSDIENPIIMCKCQTID